MKTAESSPYLDSFATFIASSSSFTLIAVITGPNVSSFLTDNKLQREEEFTDAVIFALVPFVKKGLYEL